MAPVDPTPYAHYLHELLMISADEAALMCLQVTVDNSTASSYSSFIISCPNRKGLMYDLFRTFTDVQVRVAYGKLAVKSAGRFEAELFVQEVDGARILDL